jgi:diguanylate cyclase (GGDEF)-like protein
VLTSIVGTIATITGIDYVVIDIIDADGTVSLRCMNTSRAGTEELRERWQRGANRPDPVRDEVLRTGVAFLAPDAQNDERVPENGRNYFIHTLIRSTACFPLRARDETLGIMSIASHRPLAFPPQEVELLEGLAAQVAATVKGIQLYRRLAESRQELQRVNNQLHANMGIEHHLARTDALTGIPNRRFIDEIVELEVGRARRYGQPLSVIMADVDGLKGINDGYGHHAGDEVLRFVAELARETCRAVDVAGRYGGDEFVFVLPSTELADAVALAERFRERLTGHLSSRSAGPLPVTASIGVAEWNSDTMTDPVSLVRQADRGMYLAKDAGRNRTVAAEGEVRAA